MKYQIEVDVRYKKGILDPQGKAVESALQDMGYQGISGVRVGKLIEFSFNSNKPKPEVEKMVDQMCDKLLANPNIEQYSFKVS